MHVRNACFFCLQNVWIVACIFGTCLHNIVKMDDSYYRSMLRKWYVQIPLVVISWFLVHRQECEVTYYIDTIVSFILLLLLLLLFHNELIQSVFSCRIISYFGRYTMEILLIHTIVYYVLGRRVINMLFMNKIELELAWLITWGVCIFIILMLAIPTKRVIYYINNSFIQIVILIQKNLKISE